MTIPKYSRTTARFRNFLVLKGVTQWNFNPSSLKFYCLTFTGIYFHPIFPKVSTSFCKFSMSFLFVIFLCIIQSAAKSLILYSVFLQISFTYTRNSSGPNTLPCGNQRLLWLPWIIALLLWPFVYDLQGIPLPKRLPSNLRPRPPVS